MSSTELFQLDMDILSRDSTARIHELSAASLRLALRRGGFSLDLKSLSTKCPQMPVAKLIKAVARLDGDRETTVPFLVNCLMSEGLGPQARLAAASGLTRWPSMGVGEVFQKSLTDLEAHQRARLLNSLRLASEVSRTAFHAHSSTEAFKEGHALALPFVQWVLCHKGYVDAYTSTEEIRSFLLAVSKRLDDWSSSWDTWGCAAYLLEASICQDAGELRNVLGASGLALFEKRIRRHIGAD